MNARMLRLILILVSALLIIVGSCATRKIAISDEDLTKAYTGTWINKEYDASSFIVAKIIYFPDGTWKRYKGVEDKYPFDKGENTITEKWIDSNGDIWFECTWESNIFGGGHQLTKISNSGNTLEELSILYGRRVEKWDPNDLNYNYKIYYRQE
jgi:hypothetical protein